ncbi:hypothetical protein NQ315_007938, partial [Exocentrus adspersus]
LQIECLNEEEGASDERELFETAYFDAIHAAKKHIAAHRAKQESNSNGSVPVSGMSGQNSENRVTPITSKVKLPSMTLPEFKGEFDKWNQFKQLFMAVIDKNRSLSDAEKFYYLRGCLKGDAEDVLQSLEVEDESYNIAWELLKERFENKRLMIDKQIQAIFDIPNIKEESFVALRAFLDTYKKRVKSLEALGEPVASWDRVLIIEGKLDDASRREWQNVISKLDRLPILPDFTECIVARCEFVQGLQTESNKASSYSNKGHKSSNAGAGKAKVTNSKAIACVSIQKPTVCKKCSKKHNTLLHFERTESSVEKSESNQDNQAAAAVVAHSRDAGETYVLLSTAIVQVSDGRGNVQNCRILLDSGS